MNTNHRSIIAIGAFSMAMAVILGALGAHALEALLSPEQLDSFKTGVRYQAWHSLALIILGSSGNQLLGRKSLKIITFLFTGGIVFFSISIYLLNTRHLLGIDSWKSFLGPITPIGGLLLILGWVLLGFKALQRKDTLSRQNLRD
ncbi:MAG TPA: DUF423 domain-containing protein [Cryomorphaceae bacterium]|nr:DUF423 domain-containing protein [Cryomorphaceae bacterium]HKL40365.1 DUF423 domain-containing protein [Cryomorphaceae bacterium]